MGTTKGKIYLVVVAALAVRLIALETIPAEIWGDVIEQGKMILWVGKGKLPVTYWFGGDGVLMSYLAYPFISLLGMTFYHLKLVTVIIGVALVLASCYYAQILTQNTRVGLFTALLISFWFWPLSFSRQGKPYILVAFMVAIVLSLMLKGKKVWAGILGGVAMLSQASIWGITLLSFLSLSYAIPFGILAGVTLRPQIAQLSLRSGYVGEKLSGSGDIFDWSYRIGINIKNNLLAYWGKGDPSFRHTIPNQAFLDPISGIMLMVGFWVIGVYGWRNRKKLKGINLLKYWLFPFIVIQIPSVMDVQNWQTGPFMGRMIGVLPLVATATAIGIEATYRLVYRCQKFWAKVGVMGIILGIVIINSYRYFIIYPKTLPNQNIAFGKKISEYLKKQNDQIPTILAGCCWGEYGQPEPHGLLVYLGKDYPLYYWDRWTLDRTGGTILDGLDAKTNFRRIILNPDPESGFYQSLLKHGDIFLDQLISEEQTLIARAVIYTTKSTAQKLHPLELYRLSLD